MARSATCPSPRSTSWAAERALAETSELFAALEQRWRDRAVPSWQVPGPPPTAADVIDALQPLDLTAHPDTIAWFGWLGGSRREVVADHSNLRSQYEVGGDMMEMMSLSAAIDMTKMVRLIAEQAVRQTGEDPSEYWPSDALAFAVDPGGDLFAFRSDPPGSVWLLEKALPAKQADLSLASTLDRWVRQIDAGVVKWDVERQMWCLASPYLQDDDYRGGVSGPAG